jgi:Ser/Thr protein kinase RdoA (MazF antagonist)
VYELFSFVQGEKFNQSPASARESGRALAWLHKLLAEVRPTIELASVSYHNIAPIASQVLLLCQRLGAAELAGVGERLSAAYAAAAIHAEEQGFARWPAQIVHGDWHPGNVIFTPTGGIAAALDFDTARLEPRAVDIANGAMQFSITRRGDNPLEWPENLDEQRLIEFIHGYDSYSPAGVISKAEIAALPWLMIEAMIVEAIVPIAATGRFGPVGGVDFLRMVDRKVAWLQSNQSRVTALLS